MEAYSKLNSDVFPFAVGVLSVVGMLVLSAVGATVGSAKAASSAAVVGNRGSDIITKAFLPVLLASAGFMYAIIFAFIINPKLKAEMSFSEMWNILGACTVFGVGSLFSGMAIGEVNKSGIVLMSENRKVFLSLIVINSTIEMSTVFSLICAVMMV